MQIQDNVFIITGGASGLGAATATGRTSGLRPAVGTSHGTATTNFVGFRKGKPREAEQPLSLVPFVALEGLGLVHQCETGAADNSVAYAATVTTKPRCALAIVIRCSVFMAGKAAPPR